VGGETAIGRGLLAYQAKAVLQLLFIFDLPHSYRPGTGPRRIAAKVAIVGRSMVESSEIAQDLGYLTVPNGLLIHPGQIRDYQASEVMVLISGTQGEPMSALFPGRGRQSQARTR